MSVDEGESERLKGKAPNGKRERLGACLREANIRVCVRKSEFASYLQCELYIHRFWNIMSAGVH